MMLTPAQHRVMQAYVMGGSHAEAAHACGISLSTARGHMSDAYGRLGVTGFVAAATTLGWLAIPANGPIACGWVGHCSRPRGHRGHHGGFRA